jgi:uncharacterized protein YbbC (DUF1343 family)
MSNKVRTGLDIIEAAWPAQLNNSRIGLLVHPASINSNIEHAADICVKYGRFKVKAFLGPQHGIRGETQDNMIEWEGFRDKKTGLPVYSLYGKTRCPDHKMLQDIDVIVIDLQDVGARYYTFIWTLALVLEVCKEANKPVVVLDRPNPIGGHLIEGPVLKPEYKSFVGLRPLPVRHGMTIGEIALYLRDLYCASLDFHVLKMENWERRMWFDDTKLPWVLPSPNMPTLDTATVYPGMCLLEATNLSEGRGTTRPFEIFGAPFIDPDLLVKQLREFDLPGVFFRPLYFIPTFHKHAGQSCGGAQIHVLYREQFKPFKTAVGIIKAVYNLYPKDFTWKNPPYEYEKVLLPIDILAGSDRVRKDIENDLDLHKMELWWNRELTEFNKTIRQKYLLYR